MPIGNPAASGLNDGQLVDLVKSGDAEALGIVYDRYVHVVLRQAYHLTRSKQDADDVLQEVFLGLPGDFRGYEDSGRLELWLKRVTTSVSISYLRRWRSRPMISIQYSPEIVVNPEETEILDEVTLEQALLSLPDDLRSVFVLKKVEGYSHAEIGRMLSITVATSEKRLSRAMERVQNVLGSDT